MGVAVVLIILGVVAIQRNPSLLRWFPTKTQGEIREDRLVTDIVMARAVTALGTPKELVTSFTTRDKRYLMNIHTGDAPHGTNLLVRWYEGGQLLAESNTDVEGEGWTPFVFEAPEARAGIYRIDLYRDHVRVSSTLFLVRDAEGMR